ncbi:MAG: ABC transporter substrate-binding protein [Deltaproteobacteria bacterium]|nr:ABC transporter substrate-binding protein [Deltaproteobacteria bacterium]
MSKQKIKIAHSPDSDDAFMFYALQTGKITSDKYEFEIERRDIEELNQIAKDQIYDISAISIHAYAHLADKYILTKTGCSMAEKNYGPTLVSLKEISKEEIGDKTIAVPGLWTTAYLILKLINPDFKPKPMPFDQIMDAVLDQEVDAGLLIHEGQLQFEDEGLKHVLTITEEWKNMAGDLPLPLGGNAIKKSLGPQVVKDLADLQRESIQWAMNNPEEARDYARSFKRDLSAEEADKYLSWYANDRILNMGEDGVQAIEFILGKAYELGVVNQNVKLELI